MIEMLKRILDEHIQNEKEQMNAMEDKIDQIKDNHLQHLYTNITEIKADIKWIKVIGGFLVVQAIAVIIKLYVK